MGARFFLVQHTKTGYLFQMTIKYTKLPLNIPKGREMDQMATKYTSIILPSQDPSKFTQIG
jgi:hypothetical protein